MAFLSPSFSKRRIGMEAMKLDMSEIELKYAAHLNQMRLTKDERVAVSCAKVGASHEMDTMIAIIERLSGETVGAADEPTPPEQTDHLSVTDIRDAPEFFAEAVKDEVTNDWGFETALVSIWVTTPGASGAIEIMKGTTTLEVAEALVVKLGGKVEK
jgi:hypothetical protein